MTVHLQSRYSLHLSESSGSVHDLVDSDADIKSLDLSSRDYYYYDYYDYYNDYQESDTSTQPGG